LLKIATSIDVLYIHSLRSIHVVGSYFSSTWYQEARADPAPHRLRTTGHEGAPALGRQRDACAHVWAAGDDLVHGALMSLNLPNHVAKFTIITELLGFTELYMKIFGRHP
jgi:hypothetical protein